MNEIRLKMEENYGVIFKKDEYFQQEFIITLIDKTSQPVCAIVTFH